MPKTSALLSAKDLRNPHKLDRSFVDSVIAPFSHVNADDADVARRLVRYIVDGTDSEVVLEAAGRVSIGTALSLHHTFLSNNVQAWKLMAKRVKERQECLWPTKAVPAEVWMRLGQAFEALFLAGNIKPTVLPGWPGWLKALLGMMMAFREHDSKNSYWTPDRLEAILELAGVAKDALVHLMLDPQQMNTLSELQGTYAGFSYHGDHFLEKADGWPAYLARYTGTVQALLQNRK